MILLFAGDPADPALEILAEGLRRSVTRGLVEVRSGGRVEAGAIQAFLAPREDQAGLVAAAAERGKVLVFGRIGPKVAVICGVAEPSPLAAGWVAAAQCPPAPVHAASESRARVEWSAQGLGVHSPYRVRPFLRFDFGNEWNNLGYGRITADGGIWSMAIAARPDTADVIATATAGGLASVPYVTLRDTAEGSVLWWNRAVGPVDSAEWAVLEAFLANWRAEALPSVPVLDEVPLGYDAAITMRLDCDEDVASARPLFELYRERGLPFSVAVMTGQPERPEHLALLEDIQRAEGAILSHSMSHPRNWGGSEQACAAEARGSAGWLERRLPGLKVRYAVSPFHQNPGFVPAGLKRAGLSGFVGGIIANDPEMLMARAGRPPGGPDGIVALSQQCMLHGDCLLEGNDPLAVTKAAFRAARQSRTLFGYLDHPISSRYDYGWGSEARRLGTHAALLDFIAAEGGSVLWLSEDAALDWVSAKSRVVIETCDGRFRVSGRSDDGLAFGVRYRGRTIPLSELADG